MKTKSIFFLIIFMGCFTMLTVNCKKEESEPPKQPVKTSGFDNAGEMQNNPDVQNAIKLSSFPVNPGTNPPTITGYYDVTGKCLNASANLNQMINLPIQSEFRLYDQTSSNTIKFTEISQGGVSTGMGGFITGSNNAFTIWLESNNSDGYTTILIFSGIKLANGDLNCQGLTVIVEDPPPYAIVGDWWKWTATFCKDNGGGSGGGGNGVNVTFNNEVFTDITITVGGLTKTIVPDGSVTFYNITGSSVSYQASTSGKTTSGTQVGMLVTWDNTITLNGVNVSRDLVTSSSTFFLYIKNNGSKNLNKVYVNYGLNSQTLDNVSIPNNGNNYRLGYYKAFSNTSVRAYKEGTSSYVSWKHGTHFTFPGSFNQSINLVCSSKKSSDEPDYRVSDAFSGNTDSLIPEPEYRVQLAYISKK